MKLELHHKVPHFVGGSNSSWNTELITPQQHLDRHIKIAEELNTSDAWASCQLIVARTDGLNYDKQYLSKKRSESQIGRIHTAETIEKMKKSQHRGFWHCGELGVFKTLREVTENTGIPRNTIYKRCKQSKNTKFDKWFFKPKEIK